MAQVQKQHNDIAIWPSVEVNHTISEQHFVFFENQWRYNSDTHSSTLSEKGITS